MEASEYRFQDQECRTPFARGGPIYVPDLISPLTRVPEFKASIVQELQDLESELSAAEDFHDELTVDELKIFTEEELVEKALKEFEDAKNVENSSPLLIEYSKEQTTDDLRISGNKGSYLESTATESNNSEICISMNGSSVGTSDKDHSRKEFPQNPKKRKKRGRVFDRDSRASELESSGFAKVEQLAKVKQKQDEDKAAARLHSFNGNFNSVEAPVSASEKIERMRSLRYITSPMKVKSSNANEHVPLFYPEVVLCVEIYHSRITWKKTQEFLVLGSQTLTELRDDIYCVMDHVMQTAEEHDPSGYFLIEDCFCNDLRDSSAIDNSKPIFDWLRNCKKEAEEKWEYVISGNLNGMQKELLGNLTASNLPQFKAVNMHKIRFCDLRFRLGAGYLYCHQGDCKHIIVIRDMRLIHPEDDQNRAAYPIVTFQHRSRYRKCSVCHIYRATKVAVDDKWAQKNPCYFCDNCHYLLHYKEDGSLLYNDFEVFDYHHEM